MRYASFFHLAYPELELDNPLSRMHCIHYASSLYGKLGDEMTGRFNQDLPENLQMAFEKAANFEPSVVLLHCGCLSLNPFIEFSIWNNSSSSDVLYIQASISISPKYESK